MGKLEALNAELEKIRNALMAKPEEEDEEKEENEAELQQMVLETIAGAIQTLGESITTANAEQLSKLDESTTAQVIEIQSGIRKIAEALTRSREINVQVDMPDTISMEVKSLTEAVRGIQPTVVVESEKPNLPLQFDIRRDRNGYMTSVIAREYEQEPAETEIEVEIE